MFAEKKQIGLLVGLVLAVLLIGPAVYAYTTSQTGGNDKGMVDTLSATPPSPSGSYPDQATSCQTSSDGGAYGWVTAW